ncbi:MAG: peptidase S41, partial [Bacteroidales bacterium]|nr:peptidase S41 [Bacteroidales bacterium]
MKKTLKYLAWGCVAMALATPVALADNDKAVNDDAAVARSLDIFNTLYKELNTFYVDTIDAQKSIENAINAMLDEIDPY